MPRGRRSCYLDCNATAPVRPEVAAVMAEAMAEPGNPSSVHGFGRRARARIEAARRKLAEQLGALPEGVIFTSGGTEANHLALLGLAGPRLVSAIEHPSVLGAVPDAARAPVAADGRLDLAAFERLQHLSCPLDCTLVKAGDHGHLMINDCKGAALVQIGVKHFSDAACFKEPRVSERLIGKDGPPGNIADSVIAVGDSVVAILLCGFKQEG